MSVYIITGGTTGIGAAVRTTLLDQGQEVFNIDLKEGDFLADLSKSEERQNAIEAVKLRYPDGIDGLFCNAGVGPTAPPKLIFSLNFFAGIEIAEGLRPLLKKKNGSCVMTSSNSVTNHTVRCDWVDMMSNVMDEDRILEMAADIPRTMAPSAYSSSKHALARWVRRVSPAWAVDGLRINAVAPGNTTTPMTQGMTDAQRDAALLIPIPTRYGRKEFLDAQEIANGMLFLASPLASGINGIILFVDGGIDALLRSERF
ncbi:SDR family oxidoreductase [Faecalicatena contorta]|uniref:SDR family oxidoreductase n=1 Tax=Faecalicatena contorta TaxID=39482 RepID=UPI00129DD1D9|nr:SDR family oxidoreductase [Faecalicatena contorta]MRM90674.1 SDR family oxidoreductase [Faecalicatena contorta]